MSSVHGKHTVLTVDGDDISAYCNASELELTAADHETHGYGVDDEEVEGGLLGGKFTASGVYEQKSTATSPKAVIQPVLGSKVVVVRKPEGTATGKPQQTFTILVTKYAESNPVGDMITWSMEGRKSGALVEINQS